jgi:peptidoglycan/xylan/chitin deacetylase (PgdA/CDA1 family)
MTTKTQTWADGFRCAVAFTFDFDAEEVWIAEDARNAERPGVLSQGTYGAKVGVPEILRVLERAGVTATFFVPGRVAERHHGRVAEIVAAGHELAHHGYTHASPAEMSREGEEAELMKGLEVLRSFGMQISGYRSPSWDHGPHTLELLEAHGFTYSSNLMDDIRPYRHVSSSIVEVPIHWILDDAPHFWFGVESWTKTIATNAHVQSLWQEEFLGIRRLGGACVFTMHPQIIGRPGRLTLLEDLVGFVQGHDDVWVATTGEIASRV